MTKPNKSASNNIHWDKHWHLSTSQLEISLTEIEFAIMRNFFAFSRWVDDCAACCHNDDEPCNGVDYTMLNIIRMHDRSKSISEIARLMNRDDISNVQYSIRKLTKANLIEKKGGQSQKRNATYQATENGIEATDKYAEFRKELLLPFIQSITDSGQKIDQISTVLTLLSGIYDQAACLAASYRVDD